jgi:hypothetical protein
MMQQVFYNLSNFIDSDLAYAAQAVVSSGTATTSDTLGGSFSYPLTSMVATTGLMRLWPMLFVHDD